jgi:hypothetical protein
MVYGYARRMRLRSETSQTPSCPHEDRKFWSLMHNPVIPEAFLASDRDIGVTQNLICQASAQLADVSAPTLCGLVASSLPI